MKVELLTAMGEDGNEVYLLVRLHADAATNRSRNPVNLALVIDRSSSMRGPRMTQALRAANLLVDQLGPRDRIAVVTFDANAQLVFGPTTVSDHEKHKLQKVLSSIDTGVGTNIAAGIKYGADALRSGFVRNAVSRVILLTDGQASLGITDPDKLARLVDKQHERGVSFTTMGVGHGFDDELLAELARRGKGGFYYLANAADIPAAFGQELSGVFAITAAQTELKLIPGATIASVELMHRLPSRPLDDGLLVELGEIADQAPRQVLFKLSRVEPTEGTRCGTLAVSFRRPDGSAGDGHVAGIELPQAGDVNAARQVTIERLRLAVAAAVDVAWARRASGDRSFAMSALDEIKDIVIATRDADRADAAALDELLANIDEADRAVAMSDKERESARRSMRQRSHSTLMGQSTIQPLPKRDD